MSAADWDGILEDGEEILWQGRPEPVWDWSDLGVRQLIRVAILTGIVLFMAYTVWRIPNPEQTLSFKTIPILFMMIWAVALLVLFNQTLGTVIRDNLRRRRTFYTLTNRTAFIGIERNGRRKLKRIALHRVHQVKWRGGDPGSILFKLEPHSNPADPRPIGFRMITETPFVWSLLKTINPRATA